MYSLGNLLLLILDLFQFILLARVLLSWFPNVDRSNPLIQFVYNVTEPVLRPVRDALMNSGMTGPMDFSPIVVWLILFVLRQLIGGMF